MISLGPKQLVAGAGFEPATFGLCIPLQLSLHPARARFCGLDFPFTLGLTVRVPAIKSLHLPRAFAQGLARDYHARGFPDFDK